MDTDKTCTVAFPIFSERFNYL